MHHLLTVQWTVDPPIGAQAFIDLEYVLAWNQGLYPATEEVGGVLQAQSLNIQQIDETIGREQRYARTHTFDHRVGADCRSMHQRSEEHTSELQSLMRISYAVFC